MTGRRRRCLVIGGPDPVGQIMAQLEAGTITLVEADALVEFLEVLNPAVVRVTRRDRGPVCDA